MPSDDDEKTRLRRTVSGMMRRLPPVRRAKPINDEASYYEARAELERVFGPPEGSPVIQTLRTDATYLLGSTAPNLQTRFEQLPSGVVVPEGLARPPQAGDFLGSYITASEIFGADDRLRAGLLGISVRDIQSTVLALAQLLRRLDERPKDQARDREFAALLRSPYRGIAEDLIASGRALISSQAVWVLMKLAITQASPRPRKVEGGNDWILLALLAVQDLLDNDRGDRPPDIPGIVGDARAVVALIRSQLIGAQGDPYTILAHAQLRWRDLPRRNRERPEFVDLEAVFRDATHVPLDDLVSVGLAIWAAGESRCTHLVQTKILENLKMPRARVLRAFRLIAAGPAELAREVASEGTGAHLEWSIDAFRRFPILRLYGGTLLVLSPRLLLERIFEVVRFDIETTLKARGRASDASRAMAFWRLMCEEDALEALRAMAPPVLGNQRLYTQADIASAYATNRRAHPKVADFALEYEDAWVVGDVTVSTLSRDIFGMDPIGSITRGIDKLVAKARQIDSSIKMLRHDEQALTHAPRSRAKRFHPMLVMAEGFPVNPATLAILRHQLALEGILQGADVAPLTLVDNDELSMLEAQVDTGKTLVELLNSYQTGYLRNMGVRDHLLVELRVDGRKRPARLDNPFHEAWTPIFAAIGEANTDHERI